MKKIFATMILLLITQSAIAAGNPEFIKFALNSAHERGFLGCDNAISEIFKLSSGDDMRVSTKYFQELKKDSLKMTAVYGSKGDSVFIEVELRKVGSSCYATNTSILTGEKSCAAFAAEMPAFKYDAEAPDHIWMKNAGGSTLILRPVGNSCIAIFQNEQKF